MINQKAMESLFNPYKVQYKTIDDFLDVTGVSLKQIVKISVQDECSKSIDETCINTECHHNMLNSHEDELYWEVFKEVQQERMEVKERTKKQMQKHYGTSFGD